MLRVTKVVPDVGSYNAAMAKRIESGIGRLLGRVGLVPHRRPPFLTRDWRYHYRPDRRVLDLLGPGLSAPVPWPAPGEPTLPSGELAAIFLATPGFHKWVHYLPIYERTLAGVRNTAVRLLEIGVDRGGSLAAWRQYLGPEATLVGIDIDPSCAAHGDPAHGTHVRIGAQQDAAFLRSVVQEFGAFDVILDDGSHVASHLVATFRCLFAEGLAGGGLYLAEDLQTSYWRHYRDAPLSFIDVAKGLVDLLHAQYQDEGMLETDFRAGPGRRREVTVPRIVRLIESIEFHDGLVVIRKAQGLRELPSSIRTP